MTVKKLISAILVMLVCLLLGTTAFAEANETSGKCGENLSWTFANGVLSIEGTGAMEDYIFPAPWDSLKDKVTKLNLSEGMTSIGSYAFKDMRNVTSVTIPSSVKTIGGFAFWNCSGIKEATIPNGYIGESTFINCTSLEKVTIGSGVTAIGVSAFENCPSMKGVYISDIAKWCNIYFGGYLSNPTESSPEQTHLYLNGQEIIDLVIPSGVTSINDYAFYLCKNIKSVTIPASVTYIGEYAFCLNSNLETVNIPSSGLKTIGAQAFEGDTSLRNFEMPTTVSYIGSYAFRFVAINHVKIQQGFIGAHAFEGCGNMNDITIGNGVYYIGEDAFKGTVQKVDSTVKQARQTVMMGNYAGSPIEWEVLDIENGKALLISKYILDFEMFNLNDVVMLKWEDSDLRTWLNGDFYNTAFTTSEKNSIYTTTITDDVNPKFGTTGGAATENKLYILSASELNTYFDNNEDRMAQATAYAKSQSGDSAIYHPNLGSSYWWVRTTGMYDYNQCYVHYTGNILYDGMSKANYITGIRPVMWIDVDSVGIDDTQSQVEQFVSRLYNECLLRDPEQAGLADWTNRLMSGTLSGTGAAHGIVFSQEYKNRNLCNEDYVENLYNAFMGRKSDAGGKADWVGKLESGVTREAVFNGFAMSKEFSNLCAEYGILVGDAIQEPQSGTVATGKCSVCGKDNSSDGVTAFVTRLYTICLGRTPDAHGLQDWTNQLRNHTNTGRGVSYGFIFSIEFTNKKLNNSDFVECLYSAFFDRPSDAAGKADWVNKLNRGWTREQVFDGFIGSQEFTNLCNKFGITRD